MADKNTGTPATGTGTASSETDDNKDDAKEPATGSGTAPATGATSSEAEWTPPTREEWEAQAKSVKNLEEAQKKANKEAEASRRKLADADKAKMTDDEAKEAELKELREAKEDWQVQMAQAAIERQVTRLVPTLGIVDPEVVTRLLDWDKITFEDGNPADGEVEREVKNLLQSKPYLSQKGGPAPATRTGSNATDATSGSGPKPNMTSDELAAAQQAGIEPAKWAALRDLGNKRGTGVSLKDYQATIAKPGGSN